MEDSDFGKILLKLRTDSGKTVQEVSEYLTSHGYKAAIQTIYGWERGLSQPNPDPFLAMCEFYGVEDVLSAFRYSEAENKEKAPPLHGGVDRLLQIYDSLNEEGREKLLAYAEDLEDTGKYIKTLNEQN